MIAAALACLVVGGLIAVAVAGGGSDSTTSASVKSSSGSASKASGSAGGKPNGHGSPYAPLKNIEPADMVSREGCEFVSPEEFSPVTGGWHVADRRQTTTVCAGAAGTEGRSIGRFLILRTEVTQAQQHLDQVDVQGTGPLTITQAPLGAKVVTSAQRDGTLEFKGSSGVTGELHLADDTVTLNP